jgi:Ankyrin repeats (3 copies)
MEDTYRRIESQIEQRPDSLRRLAEHSLTWVLCAKRLLNELELCEAVSFEPSTEPRTILQRYTLKDILDACANLLYLEGGFVRPIHYSVKEYFAPSSHRTPVRTPSVVYHFGAAHAYLAATCLSYLLNDGLGQALCQSVHDLCFERVCKLPLCYYAAWYFDEHVVEADHTMTDLDELLCGFLTSSAVRLATVLQLRYLQLRTFGTDSLTSNETLEASFLQINGEVNGADLVYNTKLYGLRSPSLARFQTGFGAFENLPVSKLALHWACTAGSEQGVRRLLSGSVREAVDDDNGVQPLYYAAKNGSHAICEVLLTHKHSPNHSGGFFGNALQAASRGGHEKVARMLVDAGADVNAQVGWYGSALQAASYGGYEKVARILLDVGADVNAQCGEFGNALQAASFGGYDKVVQMLMAAGADVNAQGGLCGNALQAASWEGHDKVVQMLMTAGADVNAQGGSYGNALKAASVGGHDKVMQMLIDAGAMG